jgi:tetratricopeptide (TPR) repeat protein
MEPQKLLKPYGAPVHDARLLPVQPPGQIIGRDRELVSTHVAVKAGSSVFLAGPSGAGKTALAAVLAAAYIASKPGGVLWLNVPEDDFRHLVARVGRAYGLDTYTAAGGDLSKHSATVRGLLEKNVPLIVLDGMVDLNATRDFIRHCASGIPVIMANEEYGAGPWTPIELGPLSLGDAQALFGYYSGLQDASYQADIEGLCKFLDGYPMTIELAARQAAVDNMMPAEMLTTLPSSTGRDSQQIVMAIIFKRLSSAVQGMLLVLSVAFEGTATAELIGDLGNVPAAQVVPLMRQLVAHGLARESMVYGQATYALHETAQRYAVAWLKNYQRLSGVEQRMLQSVVAYVERHAHDTPADHDRLAAEMGNVLGAAAYATEQQKSEMLEQLISAVEKQAGSFVAARGFQPELEQMKKLMTLLKTDTGQMQAVPITGEPPVDSQATPVVKLTPWTVPTTTPEMPAGQATRHASSFGEETQVSDATEGRELFEAGAVTQASQPAAVSEKTQLATPIRAAVTQPVSVQVDKTIQEPPHSPEDTQSPTLFSLPTLQAQLNEARAANDTARLGPLYQTIGKYYVDHDKPAQALEQYKQALDSFTATNDRDGLAATLEALSALASSAGDFEGAIQYASQGVEMAGQSGDPGRRGRLQLALADAQMAHGDSALDAYTQAVESLRSTEDWPTIGLALGKLGDAYLAQDKPQEALMILEQALVIFHRENRRDQELKTLLQMAGAHSKRQEWPQAQTDYERALFLARECFDRSGEALCLAALGNVSKMQGQRDAALICYRQALHLAYLIEEKPLQARYALDLGSLLVDDPRMLNLAVQLLRESSAQNPDDDEVKRLLSRADKRLERMSAAGMPLPPPEAENRDYAAQAYIV